LFADLAEAVTLRDREMLEGARDSVAERVGEEGLVDAVTVAAAFHGYTRVADATGASLEKGPGSEMLKNSAKELGLSEFYGMEQRAGRDHRSQ